MRQFLILFFSFFVTFNLIAASLSLSLDRDKIYLGESIVASVKVNGANDEGIKPVFTGSFDAEVEYLGSRNQSHTMMTIVNGKMSRNEFKGRTYIYQITPSRAGQFDIGSVVINLPDGRFECPGTSFEVVGVESRPDIEALLVCTNRMLLVDSPFKISLSVLMRSLPYPNGAVEPIWPDAPLHIRSDFLDFSEIDGLKSPDPNVVLGGFARNVRGRSACFTINNYAERGFGGSFFSFNSDPFKEVPIKFRIEPDTIVRDGTNWWRYTMDFDYFPKAEGDYTFGPVSVKGSIITGANSDGTARMADVFVIAPAVTIHVIPPPEEGRPEWFSGGVGRSLNLKASLDTMRCKVGDPLALTLEMTGEISADNIKPPILNLQSDMVKDFRIYDDVIESESIPGGKRFRYRLRPLRAGTLELPAIRTAYYDSGAGAYVTVKSAPLPLQVDATTQIAAGNGGDADDDNSFIPNGILSSSSEKDCAYFYGILPGVGIYASESHFEWWLLPLLCMLAVAVRLTVFAVLRYREYTHFGRLAAAELRRFRYLARHINGRDDELVIQAIAAVRAFVAASVSSESRALTSREMQSLFVERKLSTKFIDGFINDFAELELIPYRKEDEVCSPKYLAELFSRLERSMCALPDELSSASKSVGESDWRSYGAVVLAFFISVSAAFGGIFERPPSDFDWERALSVVESAQSAEDFAVAADFYYAMVTNGFYSGSLFYNLGTTLLLAERPRAAAQAFDIAARWRGMAPDILANRLAAEKLISSSQQLPPERFFFIWHYGLPLQLRFIALQVAWNSVWLFLLGFLLLKFFVRPRKGDSPSRFIRWLSRSFLTLSVIFGIILMLFAVSIAISYKQSKSPYRIPALEADAASQFDVQSSAVDGEGGIR